METSLPFGEIKAVICDMDGVVYRGKQPLPGMQDFFAFLRQQDIPFTFATNNSSRHPQEFVQKLADMDLPNIKEWQIVSSATATADALRLRYPEGTRLHVVGGDGLRLVLREAGFVLADEQVTAVVVGIDFEFTYAKAITAVKLIREEGATFFGTNPDVTFPAPDGLKPGAGSVIAMIATASEVTPIIIGKPEMGMFEVALGRMQSQPGQTLMIGDRLNTDIEGAQRANLRTALVLTGVTTPTVLAASETQPDAVYENLVELLAAWQQEADA